MVIHHHSCSETTMILTFYQRLDCCHHQWILNKTVAVTDRQTGVYLFPWLLLGISKLAFYRIYMYDCPCLSNSYDLGQLAFFHLRCPHPLLPSPPYPPMESAASLLTSATLQDLCAPPTLHSAPIFSCTH